MPGQISFLKKVTKAKLCQISSIFKILWLLINKKLLPVMIEKYLNKSFDLFYKIYHKNIKYHIKLKINILL